ncbi:MAG: CvpA family protein [Flavobacterium sp.]
MTWIDIILGGLLVYGFAKGIWKGLVSELTGTVSLFLGIFIAIKFSGFVAGFFSGNINEYPKHAAIIAFIITFVAVIIGVAFVSKIVTKMADFSGLGIANRLLGGTFGCIKMILILSVVLHFFLKINSNHLFAEQKTLDNSLFFSPIMKVSDLIFPALEEWFESYKSSESGT